MKWNKILLPVLLILIYVGLIWLFDLQDKNIIHAIVLFIIIMVGNVFTGKIKKNKNKK